MEGILAMVEGPSTSEITTFDQIDQSLFNEMLQKSSVWDFYEITKEEYINKDKGERKPLILKYCNCMVQGKFFICYLLFLSQYLPSKSIRDLVCCLIMSFIQFLMFY